MDKAEREQKGMALGDCDVRILVIQQKAAIGISTRNFHSASRINIVSFAFLESESARGELIPAFQARR
jgi:hypothetical protein